MAVETPQVAKPSEPELPFGPAAAVMLAAGLATFVLGLLASLAEASSGAKDALQWNDRVGPLSGKTLISLMVFFVSWALLTVALRRANPPWKPVAIVTAVLVALGVLGTFPTFFEIFAD